MENYTAKQVKKMFDEAEAQPYVQYQSLKRLSKSVIEHSLQFGGDWEQTRITLLSELIKDILYHSQQYNSNDLKEVLEECIEEVNVYNKMVN